MPVDLHVHTNASDGQYSPEEVIARARLQGLSAIAITDHDTTDGIPAAQEAAAVSFPPFEQPQIIPGIELSAEETVFDSGKGRETAVDVHMLGYFINIKAPEFQDALSRFRDDRLTRAQAILRKLDALGMPLDWKRLLEIAQGGAVGRPHIARAIAELGYVENVPQAFELYLRNGGPAYVARERLSPEGAVSLIHQAGGAAVLAHPGYIHDYSDLVARLVSAGLDGVEIWHPGNNEHVRANLRALAQRYGLIATGGSDYHGEAVKPAIRLGCFTAPEGAIEALQAQAQFYHSLHDSQ